MSRAPGNDAPIGGIKVITAYGWSAPSGTKDVNEIYAESCGDEAHLDAIVEQARQIVDDALAQMTNDAVVSIALSVPCLED